MTVDDLIDESYDLKRKYTFLIGTGNDSVVLNEEISIDKAHMLYGNREVVATEDNGNGNLCMVWITADDDKPLMKDDMVNHPSHYNTKGMECIELIEYMVFGLTGIVAVYVANIVKYLYRFPDKGHAVEDLKKARWYLDKLIQHMEENGEDAD